MDSAFNRTDRWGSGRTTTTALMANDHLTPEIIAGCADGSLGAGERKAADEHLARCADCRRELAAVADLLVTAPRAQRRRLWPVVAGGLAAAALAFVLVPRVTAPPAVKATERAVGPNASSIEIVAPAADGLAGTTIVWRRVEAGATYHVTVTDTTGATRWTTETADTSVVVPDSVRLEPNSRYYLYLDALRSDGWSAQSGPRPFRTAR